MGGDSIWLQAQDFPGNLRELRQVVTRAAAQSNNGRFPGRCSSCTPGSCLRRCLRIGRAPRQTSWLLPRGRVGSPASGALCA